MQRNRPGRGMQPRHVGDPGSPRTRQATKKQAKETANEL